jgi:GNAT superfamily N-acetyltransferase
VMLRAFTESDLAGVGRLIRTTIDACYTESYPPRALDFFKRYHSDEAILDRVSRGRVLVLEDDGAIVATGAVVDDEISGVFVSPGRQGRGIGTTVMDALEAAALEDGCSHACLSVSQPARGFYERRGYRMVDECSLDVGEGQRLDYWQAVKHLGGGSEQALQPDAPNVGA